MGNPEFMREAIKGALGGARKSHGGPFGAVIVRKGKIIAGAHNTVLSTKDPTAHAEINAIRIAAKKLRGFDLSGCEIYSTCEPCPMCLCAIYWARIKKVFFGCTKEDAAKIGFDDLLFRNAMRGNSKNKPAALKQMLREECLAVFREWEKNPRRKLY
jgi:guanine deaminase